MSSHPRPSEAHPSLGTVIEICIATPSLETTIAELQRLNIHPWKIYTFDTKYNISNGTINSRPADFRLRVGFAQLTKDIAYEVIEPLDDDDDDGDGNGNGDSNGTGIFRPWLTARNGLPGIHHIAYDCNGLPWDERMKVFERDLGARFVQGGTWHGGKGTCRFAWFRVGDNDNDNDNVDNVGSTSTFIETIEFSDDWEDPVPDSVV